MLFRAMVVRTLAVFLCATVLLASTRQLVATEIDKKLLNELTAALERHRELPDAWVHLKVTKSTQFSEHYVRKTHPAAILEKLKKKGQNPADKVIERFEIIVGDHERIARIRSSKRKGEDGNVEVASLNQNYAFALIQSGQKAHLVELMPDRSAFSNSEMAQFVLRETFNMVSAHSGGFMDHKLSLLDWMNDPQRSFLPKSISRIEWDGRSLVKLEFNVTYNFGGNPPQNEIWNCYTIHDPELDWAITEFRTDALDSESGKLNSTMLNRYKHHSLQNGAVIVASMVNEFKLGDEPEGSASSINHTFDLHDESVDASRFQLSYYGLPEPKLKSDYRWWFIGLLGACLMLVAYRVKKKASDS